MALKTFVKISNVSTLSTARYCAGMMVDVLGFNIDTTTNSFLSEDDFLEITGWLVGVKFAGEFHNAQVDQIQKVLKLYPIDFIEIDNIDIVESIHLLGKPIIFRLSVDSGKQLSDLTSNLSYLDELASMVLIKSSTKEYYEELDNKICFYNGNLRLLKGYGISMDENLTIYPGIEMVAKEEEKPGCKSYGPIMDVLELIEDN